MPNMATALVSLVSGVVALIAIFGVIGLVIAFIGNRGKGLSEIQTSTITALQAQNQAQEQQIEAQEKQIKILEKKIDRLEGTFDTLQVTLKKRRGLLLEINDDLITLTDQRTGAEQTVKIKIDSGELKAI